MRLFKGRELTFASVIPVYFSPAPLLGDSCKCIELGEQQTQRGKQIERSKSKKQKKKSKIQEIQAKLMSRSSLRWTQDSVGVGFCLHTPHLPREEVCCGTGYTDISQHSHCHGCTRYLGENVSIYNPSSLHY